MTPLARVKYFRDLWPACCRRLGWNVRDEDLRRTVVLDCMREVRGPAVTTSSPRFGADETTALFVYLAFLSDQASFDKSAEWDTCKADYRAYNRARNADWHERETYGPAGSRKLQRDRFAKRTTAKGGTLDDIDPEETRKRHITMAQRHRDKLKREGKSAPAPTAYTPGHSVPPDGSVILMPAMAVAEPNPF